jgi:hypothetical protein
VKAACGEDCNKCEFRDHVKYYDERKHMMCVTAFCVKGLMPMMTVGRKLNSSHYREIKDRWSHDLSNVLKGG